MPTIDAPLNIGRAVAAVLDDLPDGQAVALMGYDGMAVAQAHRDGSEVGLTALLTEYAQTLVVLRNAAPEVPEAGAPTDVAIFTDRVSVLLWAVGEAHYIGLVQTAEAPIGRARFFLAQLRARLLHEL